MAHTAVRWTPFISLPQFDLISLAFTSHLAGECRVRDRRLMCNKVTFFFFQHLPRTVRLWRGRM
jgi:hypothetical protein